MNTALFLDKQIMDLMNDNNSQDGDHQRQHVGDNGLESKKEAIVPSYDFQPIRPNATVGLSHSALDLAGSVNSTAARAWASDLQPVPTSSARSYGSFDSLEPSKLFAEKDRNAPESADIISAIDRTVKTHVDNLLHVMEGVSARLTQLETRTRNLENLVDDVKVAIGNSHGNTDGKMRHLENILLEVQSGVQVLKDKQEIVEAQLQLSKLQVSKSETHSTHIEPTAQPPASPPQPPAPPSLPQQGLPPLQYIQPPASQHSIPAPSSQQSQLPSQFAPQQEPYFPPPGQSQPPPANQPPYQPPPPPPTQSLHQPPYQPPPQQPQYPQQPPPQLQQPSSGYNPEEPPYPQQSYPSNPPRQPPSHPPPGSTPSQQYYNGPPTPPSMYDGPGGRPSSGFPSGYSPEPYQYSGPPPSQFGSSPSLKPSHQSGNGSGYPQLPMARPLPQAVPMAAAISSSGSGGSSSPRSGSRAPVDDVIDTVTSMGFPRDQVRGTVRTLTESGQAVDLNIVLDKLMNGGDRGALMQQQQQQQQPPRGWFGGR
uniref:DUF1421 domain-containing protein n=1 Tax=Noccaea caerulescens TaxID=107243 RepID=A0A1J3ECC1_NOCCA